MYCTSLPYRSLLERSIAETARKLVYIGVTLGLAFYKTTRTSPR